MLGFEGMACIRLIGNRGRAVGNIRCRGQIIEGQQGMQLRLLRSGQVCHASGDLLGRGGVLCEVQVRIMRDTRASGMTQAPGVRGMPRG